MKHYFLVIVIHAVVMIVLVVSQLAIIKYRGSTVHIPAI